MVGKSNEEKKSGSREEGARCYVLGEPTKRDGCRSGMAVVSGRRGACGWRDRLPFDIRCSMIRRSTFDGPVACQRTSGERRAGTAGWQMAGGAAGGQCYSDAMARLVASLSLEQGPLDVDVNVKVVFLDFVFFDVDVARLSLDAEAEVEWEWERECTSPLPGSCFTAWVAESARSFPSLPFSPRSSSSPSSSSCSCSLPPPLVPVLVLVLIFVLVLPLVLFALTILPLPCLAPPPNPFGIVTIDASFLALGTVR